MVADIRRFVVAVMVATLTITASPAHSAAQPVKACPKYHAAMRKAGLPPALFSPIMYRESRCDPKAIGWNYKPGMSYKDCKRQVATLYKRCRAVKTYDSGLLQINSTWVTVTAKVCKTRYGDMTVLLRPACNLAVAGYLYKVSGIGNWRATSGKK
jgi:hypothetical protein